MSTSRSQSCESPARFIWRRKFAMFSRVVIAGWTPVRRAYSSAGSPNASQPVQWSTFHPRMRL